MTPGHPSAVPSSPATRIRFAPTRAGALAVLVLLAGSAGCGRWGGGDEAGEDDLAAAAIRDQAQDRIVPAGETLALGGSSQQRLAQVLTVGRPGDLVGITLRVACADGGIDVDVQGVAADGRPDGTTVATGVMPAGTSPAPLQAGVWVWVALRPALTVSAGDRVALVLSSTGTCASLNAPVGDTYPGGDAWFDARPNPAGQWVPLDLDEGPVDPERPSDLPFRSWIRP
jgi:hypothetical protein